MNTDDLLAIYVVLSSGGLKSVNKLKKPLVSLLL